MQRSPNIDNEPMPVLAVYTPEFPPERICHNKQQQVIQNGCVNNMHMTT